MIVLCRWYRGVYKTTLFVFYSITGSTKFLYFLYCYRRQIAYTYSIYIYIYIYLCPIYVLQARLPKLRTLIWCPSIYIMLAQRVFIQSCYCQVDIGSAPTIVLGSLWPWTVIAILSSVHLCVGHQMTQYMALTHPCRHTCTVAIQSVRTDTVIVS